MKDKTLHLAVLSLAALLAAPAPAAENAQISGRKAGVEEITVQSERSLVQIRLQLAEAEELMNTLFNEVNTDDRYDIVCRTEPRYFSNIKEKRCLPRYADNAQRDEGRSMLLRQMGVENPRPRSANEVLVEQQLIMKQKLLEAVKKSPALFEAVMHRYELTEKLKYMTEARFGEEE